MPPQPYNELIQFIPIDEDAKHGNTQLVKARRQLAEAWWGGNQWNVRGCTLKLDFEPTHYGVPK